MNKHLFYFNCGIENLADAMNEIVKGFYPGNPSTHIKQNCVPKVISQLRDFVVVEVTMGISNTFLENQWVEKYGINPNER